MVVKVGDLETEPNYELVRQKIINEIKDKSIPFVYSEKHEFKFPKGKAGPVFIAGPSATDSTIKKTVTTAKKGNLVEGFCYVNGNKELVLRVAKGTLSESAFKVKGISAFMIAKGDQKDDIKGAIGQNKMVAGNPVDIDKSKLEQFADILKRQQTSLDRTEKRVKELEEERKKAREKIAEVKKTKPDPSDVLGTKTYQDLLRQAQDVEGNINQEIGGIKPLRDFAADMIKKAGVAKTDQQKVDVVFASDKMGSTLQKLEGTAYASMKATNDAIMLLGRTEDVWAVQLKDKEQGRALSVEGSKYNLTANDAFIKGGLDIKARFQMVTDFTAETVTFLKQSGLNKTKFLEYVNRVKEKEPALWNKNAGQPAVSAREVGQLLDDGYWFGLYPNPKEPSKNIQMMFPSSLKPNILEEIRKGVKLRPVK